MIDFMADQSDSFWRKVLATTEAAIASGALQPISTQLKVLPDGGIPFGVRVVDSLNRKEAAQKKRQTQSGDKPFNPFLPYEEALFVDELSPTHICLLNKFNVVDYHLLIVTRAYEAQDTWLTRADFEALAHCMLAADGLGFYNGGTDAGASQHHKHLQLIPLKPQTGLQSVPIASVIDAQKEPLMSTRHLPQLPFVHSLHPLAAAWTESALGLMSDRLHETYLKIMTDLGMDMQAETPNLPYNLLVTRDWMMGVGRSQPTYQGIGVNSLGYAGWLLVKNLEDLDRLKQIGPINLLQKVGCPKTEHS